MINPIYYDIHNKVFMIYGTCYIICHISMNPGKICVCRLTDTRPLIISPSKIHYAPGTLSHNIRQHTI